MVPCRDDWNQHLDIEMPKSYASCIEIGGRWRTRLSMNDVCIHVFDRYHLVKQIYQE